MKKGLVLAPVIALGLFGGLHNVASANEVLNTSEETIQYAATTSSVYEKATEIKSGEYVNSYTNRYTPIRYYKFYYDRYSGYASLLFHPDGNHKMNVLNGNFIKVATDRNVTAEDLTYGWNYIEVIETAPGIVFDQPFKLMVAW
ncbi:hypothetical protein [Lysinibacillus capsici]|uniref:hypothetical protein n=1 Tax=Lysinibacillus capsici TaxID=2115968 RepID=UPI000E207382|nr:hypothetical protein [Lysinibacillus capsici]RDV32160.1 hypothetical protein C7B89_10615 [Lysinibacillus capsici]